MSHIIYAPLSTGCKELWTADDQRYLLKHHSTMFIEDIAEQLGRTVVATKSKAWHMGCSVKSKPIEEDEV